VLGLAVGAASWSPSACMRARPTASAPTWPPAARSSWLKYLLSSQSAILWMGVLFWMSTVFYWLGLFSKAGN
jgi:hypothetical protein